MQGGNRISGTVEKSLLGIRDFPSSWQIPLDLYLYEYAELWHLPNVLNSRSNAVLLVDISSNDISGTLGKNQNATMPLQVSVGNNYLSGSLSVAIMPHCNLLNVSPLLVSYSVDDEFIWQVGGNFFSGTISSALGSLSALQFLILSDNLFSGSLSPELGSLTALKVFDVGVNKLTGSSAVQFNLWRGITMLAINGNSGERLTTKFCLHDNQNNLD